MPIRNWFFLQSYDKARKTPGIGSTRRRQIMARKHVDYARSTPEPRTVQVHDIDTDLTTLLQPDPDPEYTAYAASHGVQRPGRHHPRTNRDGLIRMSGDKWKKLDQTERDVWDKLDETSKAIIPGRDPKIEPRLTNVHDVQEALTMV